MLAQIQCLPQPEGTPDNPSAHIEAAIQELQAAGLRLEVGALSTTVEGEPGLVWDALRRAHDACLDAGVDTVVTSIVVRQAGLAGRDRSIEGLTQKYRVETGGA